jgi:hypothetical protein
VHVALWPKASRLMPSVSVNEDLWHEQRGTGTSKQAIPEGGCGHQVKIGISGTRNRPAGETHPTIDNGRPTAGTASRLAARPRTVAPLPPMPREATRKSAPTGTDHVRDRREDLAPFWESGWRRLTMDSLAMQSNGALSSKETMNPLREVTLILSDRRTLLAEIL